MASPQRPVYTLAMTDPLWVRVYVKESDLGRIRPGMRAEVATDSYPNKRYNAWLGYISPTAEFTPKSVETTEVRSSLVYQVRIFVCNPQGELRLGMPTTVMIALGQPATSDNEHCPNP
jgi:HlyD family secretion protein